MEHLVDDATEARRRCRGVNSEITLGQESLQQELLAGLRALDLETFGQAYGKATNHWGDFYLKYDRISSLKKERKGSSKQCAINFLNLWHLEVSIMMPSQMNSCPSLLEVPDALSDFTKS